MACPQHETILRLLKHEGPADERHAVQEHVRSCPACAAVLAECRAVWDALGSWPVDTTGVDLRDRVLAAVSADERRAAARRIWLGGWPEGLRAAASVVLAAGLGVAVGAMWPTHGRQPDKNTANVSADVLAHALGLDELGGTSPTGLADEMAAAGEGAVGQEDPT